MNEDSHTPDRDGTGWDCRVGRRPVLGGSAVALAGLAGCLGLGGDNDGGPAAASVPEETSCDVCGMLLLKHPGPNGQVHLGDETPDGHDNPAWFDSLKKCHFPYVFDARDQGTAIATEYVTDYSAVDYDVSTEDGKTYVSSHADADSFAPAADLYYVVESEAQGAMGPDFFPFSEESDASSFADEHGGRVLEYDDITPALVGK